MTQKKKLYVGNLNYGTTEDDLREHFADAGEVVSVKIPQDSASGRSRGFGFVEMETAEGAAAAIEQFDNSELSGRKIFVSEAREKAGPRR
ncbi:MAG: RNA-binding protein [Chlamydiia bacterium]|nr:RNA-binding protein [Chlamydiia bacterium]MCP5509117.1 RNA-binding protein [Chlamydiales bacterium]